MRHLNRRLEFVNAYKLMRTLLYVLYVDIKVHDGFGRRLRLCLTA
jgi:hypothetical protein